MANIIKLERHAYAPELNKLHMRNGAILPAPSITTIREAKRLFMPSYFRIIATVSTHYDQAKYKGLERTYKGTVTSRADALRFAKDLRELNSGARLLNGEFLPAVKTTVKTHIIGS